MIDLEMILKYKKLLICAVPFMISMILFFIINKILKINKYIKLSFMSLIFMIIFFNTYDNDFFKMKDINFYRKYNIKRHMKNSKIRSILRKISANYHPDKTSDKKEEYLIIREVTEVLLNNDKRVLYDYYNLSINKIQNFPLIDIKDIEKNYMKFTIMDIVSQNYIFFLISIFMIFIIKDYDSGNIGSKIIMIKMAISGYQYALHKVNTFCFTDFLFPYSTFHEQQILLDYLFSFLLAIIYIHYILFGKNEKWKFIDIEKRLDSLNLDKDNAEYKNCKNELLEINKLFK